MRKMYVTVGCMIWPMISMLDKHYQSVISGIFKDVPILGSFIKYGPNFQETLDNNYWYVAVLTLYGPLPGLFGKNPVAKNILRDSAKALSTAYYAWRETELGDTNTVSSTGHVVSAFVKPTCKALIIGGAYLSFGTASLPFAGRAANVPCEPIAKFFDIVEKDKQNSNSTQDYWEYMFQQYGQTNWIMRSIDGTLGKVMSADLIGELIMNKLNVGQDITNTVGPLFNGPKNYLLNIIAGVGVPPFVLQHNQDVYTQLNTVMGTLTGWREKLLAISTVLVFKYIQKFGEEFFKNSVFTSMLRPLTATADCHMSTDTHIPHKEGLKSVQPTPEIQNSQEISNIDLTSSSGSEDISVESCPYSPYMLLEEVCPIWEPEIIA